MIDIIKKSIEKKRNKKRIWIIVITSVVIIAIGLTWYLSRPIATRPLNSNGQTTVTATPLPAVSGVKTLHIINTESQAQFSINEVLRGKPNLVEGTTNQFAGDIQVNTKVPARITIGEIKIDARTLKTDNEFRNKSINTFILKTGDNQYITFKPTQITGVPGIITPQQPFAYTITGDLTILGVTKPVSFNATSILKADGSLMGSANTTIAYADFNIFVPNLPFLAIVDKTAKLSVAIVAR